MAFLLEKQNVTTLNAESTIYTATDDLVMFGATICPIDNALQQTTVSMKVDNVYIIKDLQVEYRTTFAPIGGDTKISIPTGSIITIETDANIDITMSFNK